MTDTERMILEKLDALSCDVKDTKGAAERAEATANRAAEAAERAEVMAKKALEAAEHAETTANKALEAVERVEVIANKALEAAERAETTADKALEATVNTQLILENDISKKIDIIGEGHDFLKDGLNRALQMETKREKMELEIISLRMDVNKIKKHLDIA